MNNIIYYFIVTVFLASACTKNENKNSQSTGTIINKMGTITLYDSSIIVNDPGYEYDSLHKENKYDLLNEPEIFKYDVTYGKKKNVKKMKLFLADEFKSMDGIDGWDAIIGDDDRHDLSELPSVTRLNPNVISSMSSNLNIVMMICTNEEIIKQPDNSYKLKVNKFPFCDKVEIRYKNELVCRESATAFAITANGILTAKHCLELPYRKDKENIVLIYSKLVRNVNLSTISITEDEVYRVVDIKPGDGDFVLLIPDRPLPSFYQGKISKSFKNGSFYCIGHPLGLSVKITINGRYISDNVNNIKTSLDGFEGNSGSPVFDIGSNELVGLVIETNVRGLDYSNDKCYLVRTIGESAGYTTVIKMNHIYDFFRLQNVIP